MFEMWDALEPRYPSFPLPLRAVSRMAVGQGGRVVTASAPQPTPITNNDLFGTFFTPDESILRPFGRMIDFIVGANGTILNGPTTVMASPTTKTLMAVDGVKGYHTQAWAVGADEEIIHWTGTAWEPGNHPSVPGVTLRGISVFSATDAWAVGDGGRALHWDGTSWTAFPTGTTANLNAVVNRPPDPGFPPFFWAVGDAGTVVKWNGFVWTAQASPTSEPLYAVCFRGTPSGAALVVGGRGGAFTGSVASDALTSYSVDLLTSATTAAIGATSGNDIWVALNGPPRPTWSTRPFLGGTPSSLLHRVNGAWVPQPFASTSSISFILPLPASQVFFSGAGLYWNGTTLASTDVYFVDTPHVWGTVVDDLWFVANGSVSRNLIGTTSPAGPSGIVIVDIWGRASTDVWAISDYKLWHWNGTTWAENPLTMAGGTFGKWQLVRTTADGVWVLAQNGIFKWNGTQLTVWSKPFSGDAAGFYPIAEDAIWVVGSSGAYRWNGTEWEQRSNAAILNMSATPQRIWAVTQNDVLDFAP